MTAIEKTLRQSTVSCTMSTPTALCRGFKKFKAEIKAHLKTL